VGGGARGDSRWCTERWLWARLAAAVWRFCVSSKNQVWLFSKQASRLAQRRPSGLAQVCRASWQERLFLSDCHSGLVRPERNQLSPWLAGSVSPFSLCCGTLALVDDGCRITDPGFSAAGGDDAWMVGWWCRSSSCPRPPLVCWCWAFVFELPTACMAPATFWRAGACQPLAGSGAPVRPCWCMFPLVSPRRSLFLLLLMPHTCMHEHGCVWLPDASPCPMGCFDKSCQVCGPSSTPAPVLAVW
jgi:hypothetical protein